MNAPALIATTRRLMANDKGILAMDESEATSKRRFESLGIPQTAELRRDWREVLVSVLGLGEFISGAILSDETIRQPKNDGTPFAKALADEGIIPGIKVDLGTKDLGDHEGEKITEGLDGLRERLAEYAGLGAQFAKWRAVFPIGPGIPSEASIEANTQYLALYATLCQEQGLVPIVEPELLMEGSHGLEISYSFTEEILRQLFAELYTQGAMLEGLILKCNMVLPGYDCSHQDSVDEVADATVSCLLQAVPASVGGIAFLSGGQSPDLASARLNAMNDRFKMRLPWALSFSFGRAIQEQALKIWNGQQSNVNRAQASIYHRSQCNWAARRAEYLNAMELIQP